MRGVLSGSSHGSISHPSLPGVFSSSSGDRVPVESVFHPHPLARERAVAKADQVHEVAGRRSKHVRRLPGRFGGQREHRVARAERHGHDAIVDDAGADQARRVVARPRHDRRRRQRVALLPVRRQRSEYLPRRPNRRQSRGEIRRGRVERLLRPSLRRAGPSGSCRCRHPARSAHRARREAMRETS